MGMFTEFVLNVTIKKDTPTDVLYILDNWERGHGFNHELFDTDHWSSIGRSDSYYFPVRRRFDFIHDRILNGHWLNISGSFKNYDNEIEKFLNWINPYVDRGGFAGYYRYEEDRYPTLIYFWDYTPEKVTKMYIEDTHD
jgi:hypothetical protein